MTMEDPNTPHRLCETSRVQEAMRQGDAAIDGLRAIAARVDEINRQALNYRLRKGKNGLGSAIREFFQNNPNEVLTYKDVAAKWDATSGNIKTTVSRLCRMGVLETETVTFIRVAKGE
jgi:Fic family protein